MHVVVTGSSGRLGRSVCAGLAASGHAVVGADRAPAQLDGVDERTHRPARRAATRSSSSTSCDPTPSCTSRASPCRSARPSARSSSPTRRSPTPCSAPPRAPASAASLAASSPTVIGYSAPGWRAASVPIDETHPVHPANAYALSKLVIEETVRMFSRTARRGLRLLPPLLRDLARGVGGRTHPAGPHDRRAPRRPGASRPSASSTTSTPATRPPSSTPGSPRRPTRSTARGTSSAPPMRSRPGRWPSCWREYAPALGEAADALEGTRPVFSIDKAAERLGWRPERDWRGELAAASAMQTESRAS